jgi:hypothetical protein
MVRRNNTLRRNKLPSHLLFQETIRGCTDQNGIRKRKTEIFRKQKITQEGEGKSQDDDKGKSLNNSCATRIKNKQPKVRGRTEGSGGMFPEKDIEIYSY